MKNKNAFTLVEIMIVLVVVLLLVAIAMPNLIKAKIQANEASAQATLRTIASALENYSALNNEYPPDPTSLVGATPPYLNNNYFTSAFNGYSYSPDVLQPYSYFISAVPISTSSGIHSYTISTGAVLYEY